MNTWLSKLPYTVQCVIWKLHQFSLHGEYLQYKLLGADVLNIKNYYVFKLDKDNESMCAEYISFTRNVEKIWCDIVRIINEITDAIITDTKNFSFNPDELSLHIQSNKNPKKECQVREITDEEFYTITENGSIDFADSITNSIVHNTKDNMTDSITNNMAGNNDMDVRDDSTVYLYKQYLSQVIAAEQLILANSQLIINEYLVEKLSDFKLLANKLRDSIICDNETSIFEENIFCDEYPVPILNISTIENMDDNTELADCINKCIDIIGYSPEIFSTVFKNKLDSLLRLINNPQNRDINDLCNYYNKYDDDTFIFHSLYVSGFSKFPSLNTIVGLCTFSPEDSYFSYKKTKYMYYDKINLDAMFVYPIYRNAGFLSCITGYKLDNYFILLDNGSAFMYDQWVHVIGEINEIDINNSTLNAFKNCIDNRLKGICNSMLTNNSTLGLLKSTEIDYINSHWETQL